jgi:hypothetical protein
MIASHVRGLDLLALLVAFIVFLSGCQGITTQNPPFVHDDSNIPAADVDVYVEELPGLFQIAE